jgi:hypothetical protein
VQLTLRLAGSFGGCPAFRGTAGITRKHDTTSLLKLIEERLNRRPLATPDQRVTTLSTALGSGY